uniref:Uncharacterized protein n=1 Tax=Rhizophora mucronata TaxID=61149 RepID=A0A2P2J578_RHIMU
MGGAAQALKRIPRIKFPQRHANASGSVTREAGGNGDLAFFSSSKASMTVGGKASLQPKRTPISKQEIEAILLGGCI